jgi:transposase-like protein
MTEPEQQRKIRHRLAVLAHAEEVTGNVARTCRYYGISRPTFYKWRSRYQEHGEDGLRDQSSRPRHSPGETDADVVGKILYCSVPIVAPLRAMSRWAERASALRRIVR